MEEEEMEVFEDADFLDDEIEDTNDNESEEKEEESEKNDDSKDDSNDEDDANLDDSNNDEDSKDEEATKEDATKEDDKSNPNTPTPKTYKVMVNHKEVEVSEEDANFINYLQKGMDYDRVKDQVNTYKNDPRLSFVENLAKQANMTPEQFIQAVQDEQYQDEIDELVKSGVKEDIAKEVVDTRRQKRQESQPQVTDQQKQEEKELVDFVEYYAKINGKTFDPDTDNLPDEVWKSSANGTPLKVAYMEYLLEQKQEQQKEAQKQEQQKKQNEEAKKKAPVKGVSKGGPTKSPKKDPLFDGLFED